LGGRLVQEAFDVSGGFLLDGGLDVVTFFFESEQGWRRVMATVVSMN
jgi:hypothetical protein